MVLATPEELKVLVILGKLVADACVLIFLWHFLLLLVEGFNYVAKAANNPDMNVTWRFNERFRPMMWSAIVLTLYLTFF